MFNRYDRCQTPYFQGGQPVALTSLEVVFTVKAVAKKVYNPLFTLLIDRTSDDEAANYLPAALADSLYMGVQPTTWK